MQPSLNPSAVVLLLAAAQGLFLALVLLTHRRGNRRANRVLAALILLFALRLLETAGYWTKYLYAFPHLWLSTASFSFFFGPLLYVYARFLTMENLNLQKSEAGHFVPGLLYLAWLMPFYFLPRETKLSILEKYLAVENPQMEWRYFAIFLLQIFHMLFYVGLTLRLLRDGEHGLRGDPLSLEKVSVRWLRRLTLGFGVCVFLTLLYSAALQAGVPYSRAIDTSVLLSLAALIYGISYVALRQPEIFSGPLFLKNAPKYEKSALSPVRADAYLSRLLHAMASEKLFTNSALKLQELALKLNIPPHHLSQTINEKLGQNFFDFLNQYRVEEAKKLLADPGRQAYTILSLALEVGFNNKASFNTAFKKITGMTPSQFRDRHVKADKV